MTTVDHAFAAFLSSGRYIDSSHPAIIDFASRRIAGEKTAVEKAVRLYYAVRDEIRYDPYIPWAREDSYRASACLLAGRGFCVPKAALLAACARTVGIPSRVAFADVRNHLCTPRLRTLMRTDVFTYHGITELYLNNRWVKATPTFNITLCRRFGVIPLDFNGHDDALFHPFDQVGRRHMEYLRYHGAFADVPAEQVRAAMVAMYGSDAGDKGVGGDFAAEASSFVHLD